jgi:uncharacterized membrane protein YkoI
MSDIKRIRKNPRARAALIAALALLLGGGASGVVLAQAKGQAQGQRQEQEKAPYRSSIQVPDTDHEKDSDEDSENDEKAEGNEVDEKEGPEAESPAERAESTRFQSLAKITAEQARAAALAQVPGTATSVELENEDGNLVYGVSVKTASGERDVKVDAGNGKVLHVEK